MYDAEILKISLYSLAKTKTSISLVAGSFWESPPPKKQLFQLASQTVKTAGCRR